MSHHVKEPTHIVLYIVGYVCKLLPCSVIGLPPQCRSVYRLSALQRYGLFVSCKTFYGLFFSILQKSLLQLLLEGVKHPKDFWDYERRTLYLFTRGYILRVCDACACLPVCVLLHFTQSQTGGALHPVRLPHGTDARRNNAHDDRAAPVRFCPGLSRQRARIFTDPGSGNGRHPVKHGAGFHFREWKLG